MYLVHFGVGKPNMKTVNISLSYELYVVICELIISCLLKVIQTGFTF